MKQAIHIFSSGALVRQDNTLCFEGAKGKRFLPIETTGEIHIFGEVDLNVRLLTFLTQHGIPLHIYNYYGYYSGSYMPREHYVSGYLTLQQARHYDDPALRLRLATTFVRGAVANLIKVLMYYRRRGAAVEEPLEVLRAQAQAIAGQETIEKLMAVEGHARETYYAAWDSILAKDDFRFERRSKRPPLNRVNALISFGNSLMYVTCLSEIYRTHLDPRIGFLHSTTYRRYSLNLDIAEIFKPIIVDRTIFTLVNRGVLTAASFREETEGVILTERARDAFIRAYDERLKDTLLMPRLKRQVSYRRLIRMDLYKLEKHLLGEEGYAPYIARW